MGGRAFECLLFFMCLIFCSGTLTRVSYDRGSFPSPKELHQVFKQNDASRIRISDENHGLLKAACQNSIDVDLYVSKKNIIALSKSTAFAVAWVQREVLSFIHCMNISRLVIYIELMRENQYPLLLHALKNSNSALKSLNLHHSTKLSASFSLSSIENCFTLHLKHCTHNFRHTALQVMDFMRKSKSYLMINVNCTNGLSIRDCLIRANRVLSFLPGDDLPRWIILRKSTFSSLRDELLTLIGRRENVSHRFLSLFIEKPLFLDGEQREITETEQPLHSSHRVLIDNRVQSINNTPQLDVNTPLTTVPVINPTTPSTTPVLSPTITPATPTTTPVTTPTISSPVSSGQSWCIASQTASQTALQVALDYACGYGGAECSAIQQGGTCYEPNTVRDHASYAFNDYYQKKPVPASCNFGGTGVLTNIDPSTSTCQYPSTSTTSSVLNTTNPTGATVFGSQPKRSSNAASVSLSMPIHFTLAWHLMLLMTSKNL